MGGARAHKSVLYNEILANLQPRSSGRYVDGTVGLGGHAAGILAASQPQGQLLGLDRDPEALAVAQTRLADFGARVKLVHDSYVHMQEQAGQLGWQTVDGILLDLGASSLQFDRAERGFSFQQAGPLDMRFDPQSDLTAAEIVNEWQRDELADVLYRYGEERRSRRVAWVIEQARPLRTTIELAEVVAQALGKRSRKGGRKRIHPATRTFQALRIAVNGELEALQAVLPKAIDLLAAGGRLGIIAFHSLEDRLVKEAFRQAAKDCICPPEQPVCTCGQQAKVRLITRKPIMPTEAEIAANPRSRSARLRVVEKL